MPDPRTIAIYGLLIIGFGLMIWGAIAIAVSVDLPPFEIYRISTPLGEASTDNPQVGGGGIIFLLGLGCIVQAARMARSD